MRIPTVLLIAGCACALVGCVTINIYFPSAAVAKAVEKFIDEVWQIKQVQTGPADGKNSEAGTDAPAADVK